MTVRSVVLEVCAFVGVHPPQGSIFLTPEQDRTMWEMVQLANEMAQRIAYDTREWTTLRKRCVFTGIEDSPGVLREAHNLPADYQRMLKTAQVWRATWTTGPMAFISDPDDWLRREMQNEAVATGGEWIIENGQMHIRPGLASGVLASPGDPLADPPIPPRPAVAAETATFYYLRNTCVKLASGGFGDRFLIDDDSYVLPERLLKLGMIWQWKAYKGGSYAEDVANYEDALNNLQGGDKPAPILVGGVPVSSDAQIAYWGPSPAPGTFVGPGP